MINWGKCTGIARRKKCKQMKKQPFILGICQERLTVGCGMKKWQLTTPSGRKRGITMAEEDPFWLKTPNKNELLFFHHHTQ